jgi:hypothetical protein
MKKSIIITTSALLLLVAIIIGMYLLNGCKENDTNFSDSEISFLDSVDNSGVYAYCDLLDNAIENNYIPKELNLIFDEVTNKLTEEEINHLPSLMEFPIYSIHEELKNDSIFKSIYCKCLISDVFQKYLPRTTIDEYLINNCDIYSCSLKNLKSGTLQECYQACQNSYNLCIEGAEAAYNAYVESVSETYLECDEEASQLSFPYNYIAHLVCLAAYTYGMNAASEYYAEASEACSNSLDQCIANCDEKHKGGRME